MNRRNFLMVIMVGINLLFLAYAAATMLNPILSHLNLSTATAGTPFDSALMTDPKMEQFITYSQYVDLISMVICLIDAVIIFVKEERNILLFVFALLLYPFYPLLRSRITGDAPWLFRFLLIGGFCFMLTIGYDVYQLGKKAPVPYPQEEADVYIAGLQKQYFGFDRENSIYQVLTTVMDNTSFVVYDASIRDDYLEFTGTLNSSDSPTYTIRFSLSDYQIIYMAKNGVKLGESESAVILEDIDSAIR